MSSIGDFFVAGSETTSSTIRWGFHFLTLNPHIQDKIHRELDEFIASDSYPTLEDKEKLV